MCAERIKSHLRCLTSRKVNLRRASIHPNSSFAPLENYLVGCFVDHFIVQCKIAESMGVRVEAKSMVELKES